MKIKKLKITRRNELKICMNRVFKDCVHCCRFHKCFSEYLRRTHKGEEDRDNQPF
jgi:hypothetical protein